MRVEQQTSLDRFEEPNFGQKLMTQERIEIPQPPTMSRRTLLIGGLMAVATVMIPGGRVQTSYEHNEVLRPNELREVSPALAPVPPMGYNTWNAYGSNINEQIILDEAQTMVDLGLVDAGYKYFVIDDGWTSGIRVNNQISEDVDKFPNGMEYVVQKLKKMGLKPVIYMSIGTETCGGLTGSYGHYRADLEKIKSWGASGVKIDRCSESDLPESIEELYLQVKQAQQDIKWADALNIVCERGEVDLWKQQQNFYGSDFRTTGDIYPEMGSVYRNYILNSAQARYARPGKWMDPDLLEVFNGDLTPEQNKTHFALWLASAAPLFLSTRLNELRNPERHQDLAMLVNREALDINQDALGIQGQRVVQEGGRELLVKPLQSVDGYPRFAVVLLNRGLRRQPLGVRWDDLFHAFEKEKPQILDYASIRDVFSNSDRYGSYTGFELDLQPDESSTVIVQFNSGPSREVPDSMLKAV